MTRQIRIHALLQDTLALGVSYHYGTPATLMWPTFTSFITC